MRTIPRFSVLPVAVELPANPKAAVCVPELPPKDLLALFMSATSVQDVPLYCSVFATTGDGTCSSKN